MKGNWTLNFLAKIWLNKNDWQPKREKINITLLSDEENEAESQAKMFINILADAVRKQDRQLLAQYCHFDSRKIGDKGGIEFSDFCLEFIYKKPLNPSISSIDAGP